MSNRVYFNKDMNGGRIFKLGAPVGLSTKQAVDTGSVSTNVKWAGAKGDGITDDTAAIQSVIDGYECVYIPKGTYIVSQLNLRSGVKLFGEGVSTVLKANTDFGKVINVNSVSGVLSDITVSSLKVDGGGQTTNIYTGVKRVYGVYISNAKNITIDSLYITKCGVVNQFDILNDVNHGGYGVMCEARQGAITNILINNCYVSDIAGGGGNMGDGIYIAGYNASLSVVPTGVKVQNCYVERVARHCYALAGEGAESLGENTIFSNVYGKDAAMSGIDFEEGYNATIENFHFENCGNYTGYYDARIVYNDPNYRLCCGVATGNYTRFVTVKNGKIKNCVFGLTWGAGSGNTWDNIRIEGSVISDLGLGTARFGENCILRNIKAMTLNKPMKPFYNFDVESNLLVERCLFYSVVNISSQQGATFDRCKFFEKVTFSNNDDNKDITFRNCRFSAKVGLHFDIQNTQCEDITVDKCQFIPGAGASAEPTIGSNGIYAVWKSVRRLKVTNCTFKNIDGYGIQHANSGSQDAFSEITGNKFVSCSSGGIKITQGGKNAIISENSFFGVSGWCIDTDVISETLGFENCIITNNIADSNCVNGIRVNTGGVGSWDYCVVKENNFEKITGTKYDYTNGNPNGLYLVEQGRTYFTTQIGSSHTLGFVDAYRMCEINSSVPFTLNIPNNTSIPFPIGVPIAFSQLGTGQVTVAGLSGVTVRSKNNSLKSLGQNAVCFLVQRAVNQWYLYGDLENIVTARVQQVATSANFIFNWAANDLGVITAQAGALVVNEPTGTPTQGQPFVLRLKDNGTARAITWNAIFRGIGFVLPTTTTANKTTYVSGYYNATDSKVDIVGVLTES